MSKKSPMRVPDLRITVSLYEDQQGALTRALKQVRRGPPRTARLTTLALIGLIAENGGLPMSRNQVVLPEESPAASTTKVDPTAVEYRPMLGDNEVMDLFAGTEA